MPIWAGVAWNILFFVINVRQIELLLLGRRPVLLQPDELLLHEVAFRRLTEKEFAKLLEIGEWRELAVGEHLVHRGEQLHRLFVLGSGRVRLEVDGRRTAELRAGCLVGDTRFITGKPLNEEVVALEPTRTVSWEDEALRRLLQSDTELRAAVQEVIGEDLVAKLHPA
jgi:CRP-like cAMP-binding protein